MMRLAEDLSGRRFGRWLVVGQASPNSRQYWHCKCDCGNVRAVYGSSLRKGASVSCGCWKDQVTSERSRTHGRSRTRIYRIWSNMIGRCECPANKRWKDYGARGISVCDRWRSSFEDFLADMGEAPADRTLERRDNDRGYEPSNCIWADRVTQGRNKRNNTRLTYLGVTKTAYEWAEEFGFAKTTVIRRIHRGWSAERILTTPACTKRHPRLRESSNAQN